MPLLIPDPVLGTWAKAVPAGSHGLRLSEPPTAGLRLSAFSTAPELRLARAGGYEGPFGPDRSPESVRAVDDLLGTIVELHSRLHYEDGTRPILTAGGSVFPDRAAAVLAPLRDEAEIVLRSGAFQIHDDGFYALPSRDRVDYAMFPRLSAIAERLWAGGEPGDLTGFLRRLPVHLRRLAASGVQYRRLQGPTPLQRRDGIPGKPMGFADRERIVAELVDGLLHAQTTVPEASDDE